MKNVEVTNHAEPKGSNLRNAVLILWPSFLTACLLEGMVFAMVDPGEVHWSGLVPQPPSSLCCVKASIVPMRLLAYS